MLRPGPLDLHPHFATKNRKNRTRAMRDGSLNECVTNLHCPTHARLNAHAACPHLDAPRAPHAPRSGSASPSCSRKRPTRGFAAYASAPRRAPTRRPRCSATPTSSRGSTATSSGWRVAMPTPAPCFWRRPASPLPCRLRRGQQGLRRQEHRRHQVQPRLDEQEVHGRLRAAARG
jgi:hypothetical protein